MVNCHKFNFLLFLTINSVTTWVRELNGTSQISLVTHDAKGECERSTWDFIRSRENAKWLRKLVHTNRVAGRGYTTPHSWDQTPSCPLTIKYITIGAVVDSRVSNCCSCWCINHSIAGYIWILAINWKKRTLSFYKASPCNQWKKSISNAY